MTHDRAADLRACCEALIAGPRHRWRLDRVIQAAITVHCAAVEVPPAADVPSGGISRGWTPETCPTGLRHALGNGAGIIEGLKDAVAYAQGDQSKGRAHLVPRYPSDELIRSCAPYCADPLWCLQRKQCRRKQPAKLEDDGA